MLAPGTCAPAAEGTRQATERAPELIVRNTKDAREAYMYYPMACNGR
jgi:hypothetical protein